MPLTINDIPLPISPELEAFAYAAMDPDDAWPLEPPGWPSPQSHLGQFQFTPRWAPARRMRINRIVWPMWGMSRWAYGCFLMHATQVEDLRQSVVDPETRRINPVEIRMEAKNIGRVAGDGGIVTDTRNASTITFDRMFMLPPRIVARREPPGEDDPVSYGTNSNGLYLVPFVDERYFFNDTRVQHNTSWDECSTTWQDVVDEIVGDLDSAAADKIAGFRDDDPLGSDGNPSSGYAVSRPHPDLNHRMATRGLYFDAVASAVGMRWVAFPSEKYQFNYSGIDPISLRRYHLMSWSHSLDVRFWRSVGERGNSTVVRSAGGKLFPEIA